MSTQEPINLTVKEAREILAEYSCFEVKTVDSELEKQRLRAALLLITNLAESENLGVCADNSDQGLITLASYLQALGYEVPFEQSSVTPINEPVYIKFNGQKMTYLMDTYQGKYRGVLVSCQSEDDDIGGTYGHFPMDLFM